MNDIKKLSAFIVVLFCFHFPTSGETKIDSLKAATKQLNDSALVDTYISIVRYYLATDHQPDSMIKYARFAVDAATKYKLTGRIIFSKKALAIAFTENKEIKVAKKIFDEALDLAKSSKNVKEIISINDKLGYLYGSINEWDKSAFYYLNAAKEYEKIGDYKNLGLAYTNIVVLFRSQYQPDKILLYTNKSLEVIPKLDPATDAAVIAELYSKAAQNYLIVGDKSKEQKWVDTSLVLADSCLKICSRYNIEERLADCYYILSHSYRLKKDFEKTIFYASKALSYKNVLPEKKIFNIYISLAQTYFEAKNYSLSQNYLDTSNTLPSSKVYDGNFIVAELEYQLYRKTDQHEKSLAALERLTKIKQEIQDTERNKTMNDLETKYQTELKEAKIAQLSQQQEIDSLQIRSLVGIVAAIILLLLVIVFFYRQSVIKNKLKTMETEQRLNRARMNPHFFFNALTSVQTLAADPVNSSKVVSLVSKFSKIMRQSLESTYTELVSIEEENSFLQNYLDLQKIRYPDKFDYAFMIAEEIDPSELKIPGMIIQPFVENSIEHGFKNIDHKGFVSVAFTKEEQLLKIIVQDNGTGFSENEKHKSYPSRATQIIKDRLTLLNQQYRSNARYEIQEAKTGGAVIVIWLPVLY